MYTTLRVVRISLFNQCHNKEFCVFRGKVILKRKRNIFFLCLHSLIYNRLCKHGKRFLFLNCGMTQEQRMFCEESLGKVNAKDLELFQNRLVHECYCLKVLITKWNKWSRKRRILMSKTLINGADGVANWSGVVNFHCFIFSDD